jgi:hypothetical protein
MRGLRQICHNFKDVISCLRQRIHDSCRRLSNVFIVPNTFEHSTRAVTATVQRGRESYSGRQLDVTRCGISTCGRGMNDTFVRSKSDWIDNISSFAESQAACSEVSLDIRSASHVRCHYRWSNAQTQGNCACVT